MAVIRHFTIRERGPAMSKQVVAFVLLALAALVSICNAEPRPDSLGSAQSSTLDALQGDDSLLTTSRARFLQSTLSCLPGTYVSGTKCVACPAGSISTITNATKCTACPKGSYQSSTGKNVCTKCPPGKYSNGTGSTTCSPCAPGSYLNSTGKNVCIKCPPGQYTNGTGSTTCLPCASGSYLNSTGNNVCTKCPPGQQTNGTGSASCSPAPCGAGSYSSNSTCKLCPIGTFNDVNSTSLCKKCPPGTYNFNIGTTSSKGCLACPSGTYSNKTAQTSSAACVSCPAGTYNTLSRQADLKACISCPAGSYSSTVKATTSSTCLSCPVGTYNNKTRQSSLSACVSCAAGTYNNKTRQESVSACLSCPATYYQPSSGQPLCMPCPSGQVSSKGFTSCKVSLPTSFPSTYSFIDTTAQSIISTMGVYISTMSGSTQSCPEQTGSSNVGTDFSEDDVAFLSSPATDMAAILYGNSPPYSASIGLGVSGTLYFDTPVLNTFVPVVGKTVGQIFLDEINSLGYDPPLQLGSFSAQDPSLIVSASVAYYPPCISIDANSSGAVVLQMYTNQGPLYLVKSMASLFVSRLGIVLSISSSPSRYTTTTSLVFDTTTGIRIVEMALVGSSDLGSMLSDIGISWPVPSNFLTFADPTLKFITGPVPLPDGGFVNRTLVASVLVSIPSLNLESTQAVIVVVQSSTFALQLTGEWAPFNDVPQLVFSDASLFVFSDNLAGSLAGNFFGIDAQVFMTMPTKNSSLVKQSAIVTAYNVNAYNILSGLFGVPSFLQPLLKAIDFSLLSANYTKGSGVDVVAIPNLDGAPELKLVLTAIGISPTSLALEANAAVGIKLGVTKFFTVPLPAPTFTQPGTGQVSFGASSATKSLQVIALFTSGVNIPGASNPLNFSLSIAFDIGHKSTFTLAGASTSPFSLTAFPYIVIDRFFLSASFLLQGFTLTQLELVASTTLFSVSSTQVVYYDATVVPPAAFVSITLNAPVTLSSVLGLSGKLPAVIDMELRSASISFAAKDINTANFNVKAGLIVQAEARLFGGALSAYLSLQTFNMNGVAFYINLDVSEISKILSKVTESVANSLNSASTSITNALKDINAALDTAKANLATVTANSVRAQQVLEAFKAKVNQDFANAQAKVNSAQAAFDAEKSKAQTAINNAKSAVDRAQASFNAAKDKANSDLNNAQNTVNSLQSQIDSTCCSWRCIPGCAKKAALEAAKATANAALSVAKAVASAVLNGAQATSLKTAEAVLTTANAAYQGILSGSQFAALNAAKAALTAAQKVAEGVTQSAQYADAQAAKVAVELATGVLNGAQAAVNAGGAGLKAAISEASSALTSLSSSLLVQSVSFAFDVGVGRPNSITAAISFTFFDAPNSLEFGTTGIDNIVGNLANQAIDKLKDKLKNSLLVKYL